MRKGYIAVLDSGIGGISLLYELEKFLPNEKFLYLGDNANAPYGNKTKEQLLALTKRNIDYLKTYKIKAIVLGCNTLSTNLEREIIDYSGLPVFGVYPPIDEIKKGEKTLLLATKRTAEKYSENVDLTVVGLEGLAKEIEEKKFDLKSVNFSQILRKETGWKKVDRIGYFHTVILGCTHYNFIKNEILDHFRPQKVISGQYFTAQKVAGWLANNKSLENNRGFSVSFIGAHAKENYAFYVSGGQVGKKI